MSDRPLTTGEVADLCHVHLRTVLQWVHDGKLKAYRTPGNHSRVKVDDFLAFLKQYDMPIPDNLLFRGTTHKVLVVDDDANMVSSFKRLLKKDSRFEVEVAFDGFEAGIKLLLFKPDLVILDMRMPGMNGYEVSLKIKRSSVCAHTRIICVSAFFEAPDKKKLSEIGVNACLDKPFSAPDLMDAVRACLGIRAAEPPPVAMA